MSEDTTAPDSGASGSAGADAESESWREVGQQFKRLGQSLAAAFQAAWEKDEMRDEVEELKAGLEVLVDEVGRAIHDTANSPEVVQAVDEAVQAGERAVKGASPHVLSALNAVSRELETLIEKMNAPGAPAAAAEPDRGETE